MNSLPNAKGNSVAPKLFWQNSQCRFRLLLLLASFASLWSSTARFLDCACAATGSSSSVVCGQQCQEQQRQALIALYHAWAGPYWRRKDDWLSDKHHCQWQGVSCCPTTSNHLSNPPWTAADAWQIVDIAKCCCASPGAVSALQLPGNNLTGQLNLLGGALTGTLLLINLDNNNLHGPIDSILQYQQLQGVYLARNALSSSIPASISNLMNLQVLSVAYNMLTGTIPTAGMMQLQQLVMLSIEDNR